jgi:hypothetical protein
VRGLTPLSSDAHLEVGLPSQWLNESAITLIDTPGLNSTSLGTFDTAWSAAAAAPICIYAMRATEVVKKTDEQFLSSLAARKIPVIIVITQFDRIGADIWDSDIVRRVSQHVKTRLGDLNLAPLAVFATSIHFNDDGVSGIKRLRENLSEIVQTHREEIISRLLVRETINLIDAEIREASLKREFLKQETQNTQQEIAKYLSELEGDSVEKERYFVVTKRRLQTQIDRLRLSVHNEMSEYSLKIMHNIVMELDKIISEEQLENFIYGRLRAIIDGWRLTYINTTSLKLRELNQETTAVIYDGLLKKLKSCECEFSKFSQFLPTGINPETIRDIYQEDNSLDEELKQLNEQITNLQPNLEEQVTLDELKRELSYSINQRNALVYEPQIQKICLSQGKEQWGEIGRFLGGTADLILMLAPIPLAGKFGQLLSKIPGGGIVASGIQKYNSFLAGRDRLLRNLFIGAQQTAETFGTTLPGLPPAGSINTSQFRIVLHNIAQNLSLKTWGERLGNVLGNIIQPDHIVEVENLEIRKEYLDLVKPLKHRIHTLRHQLISASSQYSKTTEEFNQLLSNRKLLAVEIENMRNNKHNENKNQLAQLQELQVIQSKTTLLASIENELHSRNEDTLQGDLREQVDDVFKELSNHLLNGLEERSRNAMQDLAQAIQCTTDMRKEKVNNVNFELDKLEQQIAKLQTALLALRKV